VRSEATVGRGLIHTVGVDRNLIVLKGCYITKAVRDAIIIMFDACSDTGASVVFKRRLWRPGCFDKGIRGRADRGKTEGMGSGSNWCGLTSYQHRQGCRCS